MNSVTDIRTPPYADYVLDALLAWRQEGQRTALLTLVRIDGSSPRPLGSQLAVAEDGRALGAISGGCVEQTLIHDALSAIRAQTNHLELYGEGSRFKDITLPCGSAIYVYFDVTLSDAELTQLVAARHNRTTATYRCNDVPDFVRAYTPQCRLLIFGSGPIVTALAQISLLCEIDTRVHSPDDDTRTAAARFSAALPMTSPQDWDTTGIDAYTAIVCLFHDHDYEPDILHQALSSPAFYIAALGSRRTHQNRLQHLSERGWSDVDVLRINGPAGLDIGAQTPPEIALSITGQLVEAFRKR